MKTRIQTGLFGLSSSNFLSVTIVLFFLMTVPQSLAQAQAAPPELEPVSISVVVANPSKEKSHTIPVKIDLPHEINPEDILERGDLALHYDDQRSIYFLHNEAVELEPQETKVFEVVVKNVWIIPQAEIEELRDYGQLLIKRLEKSEYGEAGLKLFKLINSRLDRIIERQADETMGQKQRIGAYRQNLQMIEEVKEYLQKMEKILSFQGGPPVPQMLEESDVKSDAPSTKTTWLVIFSILVFIGLLGAQFFFTWHRRASSEKDFQTRQKEKLPGASSFKAHTEDGPQSKSA